MCLLLWVLLYHHVSRWMTVYECTAGHGTTPPMSLRSTDKQPPVGAQLEVEVIEKWRIMGAVSSPCSWEALGQFQRNGIAVGWPVRAFTVTAIHLRKVANIKNIRWE